MKILKIDASARNIMSISKQLGDRLAHGLLQSGAAAGLVQRHVGNELPLLSEELLQAVALPEDERNPVQAEMAALPDTLIDELETTDMLIIGLPIYNFSVPAAFKAWVDLVARARRTFRYSENGPVGLLRDRPVYLVVASGGTALHSEIDFATPFVQHVLGFLGIRDVHVIDASRLMFGGDEKLAAAESEIDSVIAQYSAASAA